MFINVGARTDITNYYSEWLMNRIREGYVLTRNPLFPNKVYRYRLDPNVVDCLIFCTKNPEPMLGHLKELEERGFCVFFFVTITGYGKDLEPGVPDCRRVMEAFRLLSDRIGKNRICWRYDPVLITEKYTVDYHLACFEKMTEALAAWTDRCIFSFVERYKKLACTFPELRSVTEEERDILLSGMGRTAAKYGIRLQTCGDEHDYARYGIGASGCITLPLMEKAMGHKLKAPKSRPVRKGCGCIPSHDIGAYDTCISGCRYCYATRDHALAKENYKKHDPCSPLLLGRLLPGDEVIEAKQESFLESDGYVQMTLDL